MPVGACETYREHLNYYRARRTQNACRQKLSEGPDSKDTPGSVHSDDTNRGSQTTCRKRTTSFLWGRAHHLSVVRGPGFLYGLLVSLLYSSANSGSVFPLQACVVEVLEGERRKWERCEWERRAMFTEDEVSLDKETMSCVGGDLDSVVRM